MSVELKELHNGKLLEVHLTGKLVKTDYETLFARRGAVGQTARQAPDACGVQ
jgi:hypothetical protein